MTDSFEISGPGSLSLQEMLDLDIKSEKELHDLFSSTNLDFKELPAINLDEDSLGNTIFLNLNFNQIDLF